MRLSAAATQSDRSPWATTVRILLALTGVVASLGFRLNPTFDATWDVPWAVATGIVVARAFWLVGGRATGSAWLPVSICVATFAIGMFRDRTLAFGPARWEFAVVALAMLALLAAISPTRATVGTLVVAAFALVVVQLFAPPVQGVPLTRHFDAALAAGAVLTTSLAARRQTVLAVVAATATVALCWFVRNSAVCHSTGYSTLHPKALSDFTAELLLLVAAFVVGSTGTGFPDASPRGQGTSIVVASQRHPWIASGAVALVFLGCAQVWVTQTRFHAPWFRPFEFLDEQTLLTFLLVGFSFLAHIGRTGRVAFDSLAPWLAANAAVPLLAWAALSDVYRPWTTALSAALVVALWPLFASAVIRTSTSASTARVLAVALPAALLAIPVVAPDVYRSGDPIRVGTICCVLLLPLAFHAAVRSYLRPDWTLVAATALGALWGFARIGAYDGLEHANYRAFVVDPAVGMIAGLLIVAARRLRGMTAVPRRHPIIADFGEQWRRASRARPS